MPTPGNLYRYRNPHNTVVSVKIYEIQNNKYVGKTVDEIFNKTDIFMFIDFVQVSSKHCLAKILYKEKIGWIAGVTKKADFDFLYEEVIE